MIKALAAAGLAGHGLIHLIGFLVPWQIAVVDGFAYRTTALGGAIALGELGARLVGIAWLVLAIGFVIAAVAAARGAPWARVLTGILAVASLLVCVHGLPEPAAGIAVNLGILAALAWAAFGRGAVAASPA